MKKSYIRLLISSIVFLLITVLNCIFKFFNSYTLILFLLIFLITIYYYLGFERNSKRFQKDIIIQILTYSIVYYILTYALGFYIGFLKTGYDLSFLSIIKHILPIILTIPLLELIRYIFVSKGFIYKSIIVLTIINFIVVDITLLFGMYNMLEFILLLLIPSVARNIFLSYTTYKVGFKASIIYRYIFELPVYILPIFPAFGTYIDSLQKFLVPFVILYLLNRNFVGTKNDEIVSRRNPEILKKLLIFIIIIFLSTIIALTTKAFRYFSVSIGSNSMHPVINKGDFVIIEKLSEKEIYKLKEGDILVFKHDNIMIVHRIIKIMEVNGEKYFYTKGDNNDSNDGYPITENDIIGTTLINIPYIGYPAVEINEMLK